MWKRLAIAVGAIVVLFSFVLAFMDEPLRRLMVREANEALSGYRLSIGALDVHLLSLSVELEQVLIVQDEHPETPVLQLPHWKAHLDWGQLLRGHIVSEHELDQPQVNISRSQAESEQQDAADLSERGWQEAVKAIYPVAINRLEIRRGSVRYRDRADGQPLELTAIDALAQNIRNVDTPGETYPSTLTLDADMLSPGHLSLSGRANFLAEPFAALLADFEIRDADLSAFPVSTIQNNLEVQAGRLDAKGALEYAPWAQQLTCSSVTIDGLQANLAYPEEPAAQPPSPLAKAAQDPSSAASDTQLTYDMQQIHLTNAELGVVNHEVTPPYRLFVKDLDMTVKDLSTKPAASSSSTVSLTGRFMGSGDLQATGQFNTLSASPDFSLAIKILHTPLKALNPLFRAHADMDVSEGQFAFFTELTVHNGQMKGYLKPLFKDVDVYDPEQDKEKGLFQAFYEGVVETLADLLKNDERGEVATTTQLTGPLADPRMSTWQVLVNLARNAFFDAILPGFQREQKKGA